MKKLLIVESPAKIKTISKILGSDFTIASTVGHIKDLPSKKLGVTIDGSIEIDYTVLEGKEKVISELRKQARNADIIYLAPDPDREGEIIAWHVEQEIAPIIKNKKNIHRITFNEITKPALEDALANPKDIDQNKVSAQQARRILDRLVGYEVSPILWRKIARGLSAGRVQSVALKLIVDREEQVVNFVKEEYWSIDGLFKIQKKSFTATLTHINKKKAIIPNETKAQEIVKEVGKQNYKVDDVKDTKRLKNPAAPFMTSTIQQAAYNQLGFNVQKTMQLAQKLYEGMPLSDDSTPVALITYMRTDSARISDVATKQARSYISSTYGKDYLPSKAQIYSKKKGSTQDAHEAIRPIDIKNTPEFVKKYIPADAAKLYDLIWRRFVACQMKSAEYAQRQVIISGGPYTFKVTGSTLLYDGFLKVYRDDEDQESEKDKNKALPKEIQKDSKLDLEKTTPKQHFTQPPPRYTEATLVKELEKEGIGRPSTYATILKTIQARSYTTLEKKRFIPTELGKVVTKMLTENLPTIMNTAFTAKMEEKLDKIAQGDLDRDALLKTFYKDFQKALESFKVEAKKPVEKTDMQCPKCKEGNLVVRVGKSGSFIGCERFPECDFTSNFERQDGKIKLVDAPALKVLEEECPKCSKPLRQMVGKFGPFVSCSGYPTCKYIQQVKANFQCPLCHKGDVVQRRWKGNIFWGCSRYPECKFTISGDIEQIPCPECKSPYLQKKTSGGEIILVCGSKECTYKSKAE